MEIDSFFFWKVGLMVLALIGSSSSTLSPTGVNFEVVALIAIKSGLHDPYNAMENWDANSVDPCSWRMITCSPDGYVSALLLQNNEISGFIPTSIGSLEKLDMLDLSNNKLTDKIPGSIGDLKNLNYLRLNNNSLTGSIPGSLSKVEGLTLVDLSYNNLSGSVPTISARTFKIVGNPLICGQGSQNNCPAVYPERLSFPAHNEKGYSKSGAKHHIAMLLELALVLSF